MDTNEMSGNQRQQNVKSERKGRNKGGAFGPGSYCVCNKCGEKIPHKRGIKCTTIKCPKCGHTMIRQELLKNNK